ncbi:MAG: dickkopf-related protein [Myxococcales bacterium]
MTSSRTLTLVASAAMALFASGCVYNDWRGCQNEGCCREGSCYVSTPDASGLPLVCQSNSDCAANEYCVKGACRPVPDDSKTCVVAADCAKGQMCINGICSSLCAKDSDCATGQICKDMFCTTKPADPPGPDAGTVEPPPVGDDAGTIEPPPAADAGTTEPKSCQFNADCGEGLYCINQECHLGCASDNECPALQMCKVGICQDRPAAECLTGADCALGQDCVDGACKVRCSTSGQCSAGEILQAGLLQSRLRRDLRDQL